MEMGGLRKTVEANTRKGAYCMVMLTTSLGRLGTRGQENRPWSDYSASGPRTKNETPSVQISYSYERQGGQM
jgi:hypothetical protein